MLLSLTQKVDANKLDNKLARAGVMLPLPVQN